MLGHVHGVPHIFYDKAVILDFVFAPMFRKSSTRLRKP